MQAARALTGQGLTPLLIDTRDRLFGRAAAQTLFDWQHQLDRGQILALPLADGLAWHAPGLHVSARGLAEATRHFDVLLIDCTLADIAQYAAGAREQALLAVRPDTLQTVYALLKTRAETGGLPTLLTGEAVSCERIRQACQRFLNATVAAALACIPDEDDAIAALAVRMAHEEPGCQPRYKTGHT
ncbi:MAG: hypothetical protein B7Y26_10025 [Hydrogenophilales bacterium 16-64-46]|nr:MAG: hypothetical protein B7Z32_05915 [Hydrogenophilales bacterium 12-64-13]OYZ04954.1 MAG: hypothetical protein B7Y26_10025 [Hydrogenophilales bacterium 16-64-46]OZA37598.1 MAG: hypothetical protein B7X87_10745 [Hydrogenophilales bacterium 17-64-34]